MIVWHAEEVKFLLQITENAFIIKKYLVNLKCKFTCDFFILNLIKKKYYS
jgi:hypothetical protein